MRLFEIILLVVITILPFVKRRLLAHIQPNHIILFLLLLMSLHLFTEGWRWQMIPAYLLVLLLGWIIKVIDLTKPVSLSLIRVSAFFGLSFLILLSWTLPMILPVFSLPEPRGSYSVGTDYIYHQTELDEIITSDTTDKRELLYKIWYPSNADVSNLKGEIYIDKGSRNGFANKYGISPSMLNYLDRIETFAFAGISVAEGPFPVLIFSHGYGSMVKRLSNVLYTALMAILLTMNHHVLIPL